MEGESAESVTTLNQDETLAPNCGEEAEKPQGFQKPEEENNEKETGDCDGETGEGLCISGAETSQQEGAVITTNTQEDEDGLPRSHLSTEEEMNAASVSSHPSITQNQQPDPCWYCLRALEPEHLLKIPEQQEDSELVSPLPSSGQKVSYQRDPRPHFGVACSSHSTCHPLWGSEGPCWGQRNQETSDQTDTCPHCHLSLPPDTLRWHEAKCQLFDGLRSSKE